MTVERESVRKTDVDAIIIKQLRSLGYME